MVLLRQILCSLTIAAIAEAILMQTSAEQVPSLHRVAPTYWKLITFFNFWPFMLISALMLFVLFVSKGFPLKPGVYQNIVIQATPAARDFFLELISILPVHSPAFFPNHSRFFFLVLVVANSGSRVGLQNKIVHPARRYRELMQVPVLSARGI